MHAIVNNTVSIIIPCYNQGRFLAEAISSLQAQTYADWEAIVVDDGSTDETSMVASRLCDGDFRVRYLGKSNGGLASARNVGIIASKGAYIQFLDADDRIAEHKFEVQVKALQKHPETGIVYGNARYFHDGDNGKFTRGPYADGPDHDWIVDAWYDPRPMLDKFVERNLFPVCAPLLRRSVVDAVGFFREELMALEDWDYWFRCAIKGIVFRYVGEGCSDSLVRMHSSSMTQDVQKMQLAGYRMRLLSHEQLPTGRLRDVNRTHLLWSCNILGPEGRADRFSRIYRSCRPWRERVLVKISELCDVGGRLHFAARAIGRRFPSRIRHRLANMGLGFPS